MTTGGIQAAELVTLSPENHAEYAPKGKEADAVFGDWVLRNDKIVAAVGYPNFRAVLGRSSSRISRAPTMSGRIIDLTTREQPNDLLDQLEVAHLPQYGNLPRGVYSGGAAQRQDRFFDSAAIHTLPEHQPVKASRVQLHLPWQGLVSDVTYTLEDGWSYVQLDIEIVHSGAKPASVDLSTVGGLFLGPQGKDQPFEYGFDARQNLHWAYDKWFGRAYGSLSEPGVQAAGNYSLKPGEKLKIRKRVFPASNLLAVRAIANDVLGVKTSPVRLEVADKDGPVAGAEVRVTQQAGSGSEEAAGKAQVRLYGAGRTDDRGVIEFQLPPGPHEVVVSIPGRLDQRITIDATRQPALKVEIEPAGYVAAQINDEGGKSIAAKVEFRGLAGTADPFLFPETGEHLVRNLVHTHTGQFRRAVPPGDYEAVITHGPEYDAIFQKLSVTRGRETPLRATLKRVVDTTGWVSADFGNRSTVSRAFSSASQTGRVLNLIAENVEFAPATERDVISSFKPILEKLNAKHLLATSDGIGLTQRRKGHNDYNSFPVRYVPGALDGGAPQRPQHILMLFWLNAWYGPSFEKERQWQAGSEKLIQVNPPQFYPTDGGWDGMWRYFDDRRVNFEQVDRGGRLRNSGICTPWNCNHWKRSSNSRLLIPPIPRASATFPSGGTGSKRMSRPPHPWCATATSNGCACSTSATASPAWLTPMPITTFMAAAACAPISRVRPTNRATSTN
ncbi:MAG: carboxypeptidase-like regulatory domain-containing protein [Verrucomicrobiota bacterium]|nr:carboxypeptidase-like regulatory domain-containing protein [Verrucomicrobiota bacterium]